VGKKNNEIRLPSNQCGLAMSPDDKNKKKKIHVLEILPPTIRLSRDEKEVAEKIKVLVFQSMPMLVRRNQTNQSGKKTSGGGPQPSSVMAPVLPTSSLGKRNTLTIDFNLITRFSKSGFLDLLQKLVAPPFVMEEGGSICVDRLGYISKIVQLLIVGFETMQEQ
jgi:hypothetical protein